MLKLDSYIELTSAAIKSPNISDRFSEDDLKKIGSYCQQGYLQDKRSREAWERRNEAGMDLALQVQKSKSFPWPNASNVAFPLVTIAALQFHARAYPASVNGKDIVKARTIGPDPDGSKTARSLRVSQDMSWQLLEEDKDWESQQDANLLNLSIVGTTFKKSYKNGSKGHNVSELVLAKNLVLDYWAKSVESCPRKTHIIPLYRNDIRDGVFSGIYNDVLEEQWFLAPAANPRTQQQINEDNRQGVAPPSASDETTPFQMGEQHVLLDLDNDGYAEPYIITFDLTSGNVLRIVCNFLEDDVVRATVGAHRGEIQKINADQYFTKYTFIPSPDGGIYDIGFGVFLGPLNESVNSIVNQLIDSGTMAITAGGFLGKGAKIRGGTYTFAPFQWNRVDSTGDDLRKNIVPLEVREPSAVLFQLLSLLINYTNRISGANDMMVGENPGQNTPAETSRTMVEMGQKIYNAIFKRIWRCMKSEFEKLYILNRKYGRTLGPIGPAGSTRDDYLGPADGVVPAADPNITSDAMRVQLATAVKEAAMQTPGYDRDAVEMRWLRALQVDAPEQLFPGTKGQEPPKDVKLQIAELKIQADMQKLEWAKQEFTLSLMQERELNQAKIAELIAKAQEAMANAQSEMSYAKVAEINAAIAAARVEGEQLNTRIQALLSREDLRLREKEIDKPEPTKAAA